MTYNPDYEHGRTAAKQVADKVQGRKDFADLASSLLKQLKATSEPDSAIEGAFMQLLLLLENAENWANVPRPSKKR